MIIVGWRLKNKVYDLSNYLSDHDRYLDIRDWCGQDATDDYNTKAGKNKDHSVKADEMLAAYMIGELDIVPNNNELMIKLMLKLKIMLKLKNQQK